ncbi:MAG: J domain-containing protein [Phormidesmis sp.]
MTDATSGPASGDGAPQGQTARQPAALPNYYDLLGLRPGASPQDIRRAYRDLSKLYHPDTTQLETAIATAKFQVLNEAYATLSSPEKRLTYDYKIGYSRLSVIQPLSSQQSNQQSVKAGKSSAYLDPTDRPLSAGELFALFILGITFIGCLILVVTISLTRGDITLTTLDPAPTVSPQPALDQPAATPESASIHQSIAPKIESLPQ